MVKTLLDRMLLWMRRRRVPMLSVGAATHIDRSARIFADRRDSVIRLGPRCHVHVGAVLNACNGWIELGERVGVGPYTVLYGQGGLKIGDRTMLAPHCVVVAATHNFDRPGPIRGQGETRKGVTIGADVWIGAHASILDGVTIGDGAVVGAGAVVNRDIPAGAIAVGVPARVLGYRPGYEQLDPLGLT
jgi:acetyltransferase-like isoleucine patch superfamily enzyme